MAEEKSKKNVEKKEKQKKKASYKPKIRIKIRAYDNKIVDNVARIIIEAIERSGAKFSGPVPLPTEIKKYTVLRSTFVHKNSRDQYETRIHKRLIEVKNITSKTIDLLKNLQLPSGVDVEIKTI
ncbi:30S ribosomal protein S10 [bacterium]|nr:30S ribosomal protein S10 [bacterium]